MFCWELLKNNAQVYKDNGPSLKYMQLDIQEQASYSVNQAATYMTIITSLYDMTMHACM